MIPAETAAEITETAGRMDASLWWSFGAVVLLLLFSAFFSGSETALTASSRAKLHGLADKGDKRAATARALGISRVGLYKKMRKYGMLDATKEESRT